MAQQLPEEILYDKRLQERFVRQGLLSTQQLQTWLGDLTDVADQGELMTLGDHAGDISRGTPSSQS